MDKSREESPVIWFKTSLPGYSSLDDQHVGHTPQLSMSPLPQIGGINVSLAGQRECCFTTCCGILYLSMCNIVPNKTNKLGVYQIKQSCGSGEDFARRFLNNGSTSAMFP